MAADVALAEYKDPRLDFIQDYTLRTLRLKPEKWARMVVSNEQMAFITGFIEHANPQVRNHTLLNHNVLAVLLKKYKSERLAILSTFQIKTRLTCK